MRLIGKDKVTDFQAKHPTSVNALDRWVKLIETNNFRNPVDLKNIFGANVDFVSGKAVFDVGGNKVRVITLVQHDALLIQVTHVLTHEEYDKDKWK
jgi:mRNA interferase HigB